MARRNSLWNRKDEAKNQPLPTPKTPLDQKVNSKKGTSIDDFISDPSPNWSIKEHRWSFNSNMSNQNGIYLDSEKSTATGASTKELPKKRGKRPKPLLSKADLAELESTEEYSSSEESEVVKSKSKTNKKNKSNNVRGRSESPTDDEDSSGKESKGANDDSSFRWSRLPPSKLNKKGDRKKKTSSSPNALDPISQSMRSMRNAPLSSNGDRKPLKKAKSLENPFSRKPLRRTKSTRSVDVESTDLSPSESSTSEKSVPVGRKPCKRSKSNRKLDSSKRETSLGPSDLRKPQRKTKSSQSVDKNSYNLGESVDTLMHRSDSELSRIRSKLEKIKSSRNKLDESSRSRKEVRSLDRMSIKKSKSSRKMITEDSSDDDEPTEEMKAVTSDVNGNQSESDLALILSSSERRFHKTRPRESDTDEHPDAMQIWSTRLKTKYGSKSTPTAPDMSAKSPERRKQLKHTNSFRRRGLMKGNSVPALSLDASFNSDPRRGLMKENSLASLSLDASFDPRKRTNRPRTRTSINVCGNQGGRDLSSESFGGGRVRKQKPRSVRSVDDSLMHSSESDLSHMISEGRGDSDQADEPKEEVGTSQRSASNRKAIGARRSSADRLKVRKTNSSRNLDQTSDHSQKKADNRIRKAPGKTRSDGSLANIRRGGDVERKAPSRTASADHVGSFYIHPPVRIDFAGEMNESKNVSELLDDISEVLEETEKLKRIMHLETVLHNLQETFQGLDAKLDAVDLDIPMKIQTRTKVLEAENEVLRVRLDQQDEALKKHKKAANVQIVAIEEVSDKSTSELKKEFDEMKATLEEKDKTIQDQASRSKQMEVEMEEMRKEVSEGKEVATLQQRIWELEKEKTAFMTEISRLHQTNFEASQRSLLSSELTGSFQSKTSVSTDQLDDSDNHQGPGLAGWLFGSSRTTRA
ncbi:unnamed protein product [Cylindrotheca closterium]|uniref:Uncharacterized protein n=1 Tax=Cylindrotheca closterium TaxID=2856 RepID=A0AAD2FKE1_9STRA|nr:unnamed protein product [Cylindrotheca closterium]